MKEVVLQQSYGRFLALTLLLGILLMLCPTADHAFAADPEAYDLILTDNIMPGLTGMDFAQWVLGIRPGVPVIMATGFSDSVSEDRVKTLGIHTLILKPIVGSELATAVRKALDEVAATATGPA